MEGDGEREGRDGTHQWLRSCSIQCTTSRSRSRGERIGNNFAFSCSSIGSSCNAIFMHQYRVRTDEIREK